jgi:hypothetical protein
MRRQRGLVAGAARARRGFDSAAALPVYLPTTMQTYKVQVFDSRARAWVDRQKAYPDPVQARAACLVGKVCRIVKVRAEQAGADR